MKKLFGVGYNLAKNGYPWQLTPPGYGQQEPTESALERGDENHVAIGVVR